MHSCNNWLQFKIVDSFNFFVNQYKSPYSARDPVTTQIFLLLKLTRLFCNFFDLVPINSSHLIGLTPLPGLLIVVRLSVLRISPFLIAFFATIDFLTTHKFDNSLQRVFYSISKSNFNISYGFNHSF